MTEFDYNERHSTSVLLKEKEDLEKLDVLATLNGISRGEQLARMIGDELKKYTEVQLRESLKDHPDLLALVLEDH